MFLANNEIYKTIIYLLCSDSTITDVVDEYDCGLINEVYNYSRSSDEIAARRVEMTANPAYGTATCSKFALSKENCHHFKTPLISCS